jgi:hypothetical protein
MGVAASLGGEDIGEVGEERASLQAAGVGGGEQALDRALAGLGLAAERELAIDDRAAQSALGAVVGLWRTLGKQPHARDDRSALQFQAPT